MDQTGFTLLELLISLTITAVIVTIVFGGLRVGLRAWEKGEEDTEFQDRYRNVLSLLRRQIISIYIPPERRKSEGEDDLFYFEGAQDSLSFVSRRSLLSPNHTGGEMNRSGMVFVHYRISAGPEMAGGRRLSFFEKNAGLLSLDNSAGLPAGEDDFYQLIAGVGEIRFEYLKVLGVDAETGVPEWFWQPSWSFRDEKAFPRAVRITFRAEPESPSVKVVVSIEQNAIS